MCHQTVGLVSRHIEAAGIPTLSLTSARDITTGANPPRAAFLDYPLGHTSGRAHDQAGNAAVMRAALNVFATAQPPSTMVDLPFTWADDDSWKDSVMRPMATGGDGDEMVDDRRQRFDTPQYQSDSDAEAAGHSHEGEDCLVCAGIDY